MKKIMFFLTSMLCIISGSLVNAQGGKLFPREALGVQTYTYRVSMKNDVAATLDTIKALGINILESSTNPEGMESAAFRQLLDEKGMSSPSVGAGYEELVKNAAEVARKAKIIGASYVMTAWIPHEKDFDLDEAKKTVADFNAIGKVLKDSGLTFCYHTHGFEFVPYQGETLFDYIVRNTNPEYVSFEMDIMWTFHGGQNPAKLLLKYPNRWKLMHVKDLRKGVKGDLTGGTSTENDVTVGTGQLNIPEILAAAKKVGIKYYFIEDESSRIQQQVPETIKYLEKLNQ
jgi:sugar phosphate isomerase/epimerase